MVGYARRHECPKCTWFGQAVAFGGGNGFEIVPVPEPATTALIGAVALCALIGYRERRRFCRKSGANSVA